MPITKINSLVEFMHQSPNVDDLQKWFKNNGIKYNHFDDHSGSKFYPDQVRINTCTKTSITTLLPIPDTILHFLHTINAYIPENKLMAQNDISKLIHDYIKINDLFKPGNDKIIIPDLKLRTLFSLPEYYIVDYPMINTYLNNIYINSRTI
jgi:hypothetical protein